MTITKQDIKAVIFAGCAVDCGGVSICNIENHLKNKLISRAAKYQVWSDKHHCYNMYHNIDEAVDKFFALTRGKLNGKP